MISYLPVVLPVVRRFWEQKSCSQTITVTSNLFYLHIFICSNSCLIRSTSIYYLYLQRVQGVRDTRDTCSPCCGEKTKKAVYLLLACLSSTNCWKYRHEIFKALSSLETTKTNLIFEETSKMSCQNIEWAWYLVHHIHERSSYFGHWTAVRYE